MSDKHPVALTPPIPPISFTEELRLRHLAHSLAFLPCLAALAGCSTFQKEPPPPVESPITSAYQNVHTLAVAPAINLAGTRDFDPFAVSDALYTELQQVPGLNVIPLNRTLLAMRQLGVKNIEDPQQAQRIAESLGAQGLIVPAITAYDPYNPPVIGMILQMYTPRLASLAAGPSALDRPPEKQPASQATAVFNAGNQSVLRELRDFARGRTQVDSALGDQKFLMDSDLYLRFVSHAMVRRLMEVERARLSGR